MRRHFFPLDEELALLPGRLSPYLHEAVVRLSTWMPFERVPAALAFFTGTTISREAARRLTETAGAALVAAETAEVTRLERELPPSPAGPAVQQISVDGAMVPLRSGLWGEVKTLAVGTVGSRITREGDEVAHTTDLVYFSRRADAESFGRLATGTIHAAGTARAGTVCAVVDGAEWAQGFIDLHRPDAVRILDFPHAADYVSKAAHVAFGEGTRTARDWITTQLHTLKHTDPDLVLAAIAALCPTSETNGAGNDTLRQTVDQVLGYLGSRREQIAYPTFQTQGYPIGSGAVESANKLVVEARLKGSGMHWAAANVNPMVALRAGACSDAWAARWRLITTELRQQERERRTARRASHRTMATTPPVTIAPPLPEPPSAPSPPPEKLVVNGKPTAKHPWRRFHLSGSPSFSTRLARLTRLVLFRPLSIPCLAIL